MILADLMIMFKLNKL